MNNKTYIETFDHGPGGWFGMVDNFQTIKPLPVRDGAIHSYAPWWVDYNHAPPGAGYLNLLMGLATRGPVGDAMREFGGRNGFIDQNCPTNFTDMKMTLRLRGEMELRGAQVLLLIQGSHAGLISGWLLTGQPIRVESEWSQQTIRLTPDQKQWTPLGSRHDRCDHYGAVDLPTILGDVNVNIYLVLFPVNAVPLGPLTGDPHRLRAGRDYPLWTSKLPDGYVAVDTISMEFAVHP